MNENDVAKLKEWFLSQRRELPWRNNPTPYAVWISEVMLQQTQVSVVIPYFEHWMECFPTIQDLAQAPLERVLKEWEGLGYYSRARHLHEGARYIVEHFDGKLPETPELLRKIKGLGTYTIGAILSFAFHQRMPAIDGNVLRVLARYYCLQEDIKKTKTLKNIHTLAERLLPEKESWIISEALIELGATVCMRKPKCHECPLKNHCQGYLRGLADQLPIKSASKKTEYLYRGVAVIVCKNALLVQRGSKGKVMADLYEFPFVELKGMEDSLVHLQAHLLKRLNLSVEWEKELTHVKHSFTRFNARLFPHLFSLKQTKTIQGFEWLEIEELKKMPFSAGHRRIFSEVQSLRGD